MHCFIVPAPIFKNILEKGSEQQKSIARQIIDLINSFVGERQTYLHNKSYKIQKANSLLLGSASTDVRRSVYDAENKMSLPGKLVRKEGTSNSKDKTVNEAFDGSGLTHELFRKFFGRNSIDDNGMELVSTVHFGNKFANAFWNGSQMTYGDGDGQIFNSFTSVIDVIGHELTHGVTQYEAGLEYYHQSGALNEHFSDVFGSLVKQLAKSQKAEDADWLIGEGLFTDQVDGVALRSMKEPGTAYDDEIIGKDPQPGHMKDYVRTDFDNGGVHINSGIPNKAFYTFATNLGGFAWERAGQVWYDVLCHELDETSQFQDCADATLRVATKRYTASSQEVKALMDAWKAVGITPQEKSHHEKVLDMAVKYLGM